MTKIRFSPRKSVEEVEEGCVLAPNFGPDGLIPCITTNAESGEAHYFSRARQVLLHKGATSGLVQRVVEARIDDDQDTIWLRVSVAGSGASCHVEYRPCFYRAVPTRNDAGTSLVSVEDQKSFDPTAVCGDAPNPTQL